eukprot:GHVU01052996.1.p1 GENE.GHVU01052996.1~~GHVU01052996.1.p1  ORF type:complete len:266 (+),score=18.85 GHVU01052996.1:473-1270(+)
MPRHSRGWEMMTNRKEKQHISAAMPCAGNGSLCLFMLFSLTSRSNDLQMYMPTQKRLKKKSLDGRWLLQGVAASQCQGEFLMYPHSSPSPLSKFSLLLLLLLRRCHYVEDTLSYTLSGDRGKRCRRAVADAITALTGAEEEEEECSILLGFTTSRLITEASARDLATAIHFSRTTILWKHNKKSGLQYKSLPSGSRTYIEKELLGMTESHEQGTSCFLVPTPFGQSGKKYRSLDEVDKDEPIFIVLAFMNDGKLHNEFKRASSLC